MFRSRCVTHDSDAFGHHQFCETSACRGDFLRSKYLPQLLGAAPAMFRLPLPAALAPVGVLGSPLRLFLLPLLLAEALLVAPRPFGVAAFAPRLAAAGLMAVDGEAIPVQSLAAFRAGTRIVRQCARLPGKHSERWAKRSRGVNSYCGGCRAPRLYKKRKPFPILGVRRGGVFCGKTSPRSFLARSRL
jgi:hypothetical protein